MYDDDLELKKNYGVLSSANHGATMTSLAFEHLSKDHPEIAFTHVYPGYVATNIFQSGFSWVRREPPFIPTKPHISSPLLSALLLSPPPFHTARRHLLQIHPPTPPLLSGHPPSRSRRPPTLPRNLHPLPFPFFFFLIRRRASPARGGGGRRHRWCKGERSLFGE